MIEQVSKMAFRMDSSDNWRINNPVIDLGEPAMEVDTNKWKLGDGITAWNDLKYQNEQIQVPIQPEEKDEINSLSFEASETGTQMIQGQWKYTTVNDPEEKVFNGSLNIPVQESPDQKIIVSSDDITVREEENNILLDFNEQFKKDFTYLNNQAQVFIEEYDNYSEFKAHLQEFLAEEGLQLLGFKVKALRDLEVTNYNWLFNSTDGTVTKEPKTLMMVQQSESFVTSSFSCSSNNENVYINIMSKDFPITFTITNETNNIIITPKCQPVTTEEGNLSIYASGSGFGSLIIADDETLNSINNSIQFSIIGLDKSGVMKK